MFILLDRHLPPLAVHLIWFALAMLSLAALAVPFAAYYAAAWQEPWTHAAGQTSIRPGALYWTGAGLTSIVVIAWLSMLVVALAGKETDRDRRNLPVYLTVPLLIAGSTARIHPDGSHIAAACATILTLLALYAFSRGALDRNNATRHRAGYAVMAICAPAVAASFAIAHFGLGPNYLFNLSFITLFIPMAVAAWLLGWHQAFSLREPKSKQEEIAT